jgi:glycosyltransferase involved in cell wall biosynthesis
MSDIPQVSVVMSVYNGATDLCRSVDSILSQEGVKLELIVVDDGSTDYSPNILKEYANSDERVRVISQENQGLTRALIVGCAAARGQYIARQDSGDVSLSGKLAKLLEVLTRTPDASFASCSTRYVGPKGEHLYEVSRDPTNATARLLTLSLDEIQGPSSHPSTMFSRSLYESVGGYRSAFYFAQDLDLWIRLAEHGRYVVVPEVLYQASFSFASISGIYRKEQIETAEIILECARLRRSGLSEAPALREAALIRPGSKRKTDRLQRAKALYFIGECLNKRGDPQARNYFRQAVHAFPLHLKSLARLVVGYRI